MNVPPPVATTACRIGSSRRRISRSTARKYGLAVPREDVGDGHAARALRSARRCLRRASRAARASARATVVLPAAMKPDEIDLIDRHRLARAAASSSKNPGYETAPASAPRIDTGAGARRAGDRERHRQPVIAGGVDGAAVEAAAVDGEAVVVLVDATPDARGSRARASRCGRFP